MKITRSTSITRCGDSLRIKTANSHLRREIAEAVQNLMGRGYRESIPVSIEHSPTHRGLKTMAKFGSDSFRAEYLTIITYHGDNPREMVDIVNVCYRMIMDMVDYARIKHDRKAENA